MSIKGPLGLCVWMDTLSDPMCVTPFDLMELEEKLKVKKSSKQKQLIKHD